jgi:hypothetical protein
VGYDSIAKKMLNWPPTAHCALIMAAFVEPITGCSNFLSMKSTVMSCDDEVFSGLLQSLRKYLAVSISARHDLKTGRVVNQGERNAH